MAKNTIRLTESELKKVISESVKKVIKEGYYGEGGEMMYDDGDFNNHHDVPSNNPFAAEEPKRKRSYRGVLEAGQEALNILRLFRGACAHYGVYQIEKYQDMDEWIIPALNLIDSILNDKELQ